MGLARFFRSKVRMHRAQSTWGEGKICPVSIVEDIDKIVWQLDARDLDKSFDINDCKICNIGRVGPTVRSKQSSSSPIWKLNSTMFIIPTETP